MNVYLMRHGESEPAAEGAPDFERALTAQGVAKIKSCLPGIAKMIGQVEYILASPTKRARQTADLLAAHFKCRNFVDKLDALAEPGGEAAVSVMLNKLIGKENVVLIGHMPYLGDLAKYFTADDSDEEIKLKPGGLLKISFKGFPDRGEGKMHWTLTPDELARF